MHKTDVRRWTNADNFHSSWIYRNQHMFDFVKSSITIDDEMSFCEYGCGSLSPFSSIARKQNHICYRADFKQWDDDCALIDLNDKYFIPIKADIAVMSGVLEYINNIDNLFRKLSLSHSYILFSYNYFNCNNNAIDILIDRVQRQGWRNHYSLEKLFNFLKEFGYVVSLAEYKNQVIILLKFC